MKLRHLFFFGIFILVVACSYTDHDESLLHGSWDKQQWKDLTNDRIIPNQMDFTFNEDGRYEVDYGPEKEVGKYWIMGKFLHTVEDGMAEKKVEILKLTADSLIFQMNRAGTIEEVLLTKTN